MVEEHGIEGNEGTMDIILEEYFKFIPKNPATIMLVICGRSGDLNDESKTQTKPHQLCRTLKLLQDEDNDIDVNVGEVFGLLSCFGVGEDEDGITTDNEFVENADARLYACEPDVKRILEDRLLSSDDDGQKIGAIIIYPTMPYAMGQILARLFENWKKRDMLLADDITVMAISVGDDKQSSSSWRSNLVNRFQTEIIAYSPVFKAEIAFEQNVNMYILSADVIVTLWNLI